MLSACPLLVDESFGFSNSSAQANQTTSSSGSGLGSMMGGVVGGVVGVDSGWKFFNESSSTVEDGVVVMFIMHHHALVVRTSYILETFSSILVAIRYVMNSWTEHNVLPFAC